MTLPCILLTLAAVFAFWALLPRADLTVTAASVTKGTGTGASVNQQYVAGETITAGQPVYRKASDGKLWKAQSDTATDIAVLGIALHGASADQPLAVQTSGEINIGATVAVGTIYVLSAAAGGIAPWADLVATNYVQVIGIGKTTSSILLAINNTGIQHA